MSELTRDEIIRLRESVELETRSDLFAAARNLREATHLMREANAIRRRVFGKFDPDELRERTHAALHTPSKE
jgi:hypothetical protein